MINELLNPEELVYLANTLTDLTKWLGGAITLIQIIGFTGMLIGAIYTLFIGRSHGGVNYSAIIAYGIGMIIMILLPFLWGQIVGQESVVEPTSIEEAFGE